MVRRFLVATLKQAKRLVVTVVGFTVVLIGVIMFFTPGPAIIVIPAGLGILATEFVWARRLLKHVKERAAQMAKKVTGKAKNKESGAKTLSSTKEGGGHSE